MHRLTRIIACTVGCFAAAALCSVSGAAQAPTNAAADQPDPQLIKDLVAANRILADQKVVDGFGHVSVRDPKHPDRFYMSASQAPELVTADDILTYNLDGVALNANGRAEYGEKYIHAAIYKARPDVMAVVHGHPQEVIPFTISSVKLRPTYHITAFVGLGNGLPIFDVTKLFGPTDMLVDEAPRGVALAKTLGDAPAVLMRGHGFAVTGPTLPIAVARSVYIVADARVQEQAIALGGTVKYISPEETSAIQAHGENGGYRRDWEIWKRHALGESAEISPAGRGALSQPSAPSK
jgi:ribulose-5-phosphate 4-epimerase/fuculose-1-phosphate aldolase